MAVMIAAKAGGKALNSTTMTRTRQTCFASQIGAIECSIALLWRRAGDPVA
jgi:hypothetical protein